MRWMAALRGSDLTGSVREQTLCYQSIAAAVRHQGAAAVVERRHIISLSRTAWEVAVRQVCTQFAMILL